MRFEELIGEIKVYFGGLELGIRTTSSDGKSFVREYEATEKNIPYIRHRNAQGDDVYIRPKESSRFLLIDDLSKEQADKHLKRAGRLIVESSPDNYQVWIRSDRRLSSDEKKYWQKSLGTDPGANSDLRWGRCPGFTNRKPKHQKPDGTFPMAMLVLITDGNAVIPVQAQLFENKPAAAAKKTRKTPTHLKPWQDFYQADLSRADIRYAVYLLVRGIEPEKVQKMLRKQSKDIETRKEGHVEDYLERTVNKAMIYAAGAEGFKIDGK